MIYIGTHTPPFEEIKHLLSDRPLARRPNRNRLVQLDDPALRDELNA